MASSNSPLIIFSLGLLLFLSSLTLAQVELGLEGIPTINAADLPVDEHGANYSDPQVVEQILDTWAEDHPAVPDSFTSPCPELCSKLGSDPAHWYLYPSMEKLASCDKPLLLDFAIHSDVDDASTLTAIRACTTDYEASASAMRRPAPYIARCTTVNGRQVDAPVQLRVSGPRADGAIEDRIAPMAGRIGQQLSQSDETSCPENFATFASDGKVSIGLYAGSQVVQQGLVPKILAILSEYVLQEHATESMTLQVCDTDNVGAGYFLGVAVSTAGDVGFVQRSVKAWTLGQCVGDTANGAETLETLQLNIPEVVETSPSAHPATRGLFRLSARADCKTTKVKAGEGCWAVAQRCGTTEANLKKFNTRSNFCDSLAADELVCCSSGTLPDTTLAPNADGSCKTTRVEHLELCDKLAAKCGTTYTDLIKVNPAKDFCNKLMPGQHVCCGRGKLPDFAPKPNSDGSCSAYTVKKDDSCSIIAASYSLTIDQLETFNKKTWGWNGCKVPLWVGVRLCLSTGAPPMPAPVENAVCGPTMPGTKTPAAGVDLATLNPCLLKTCCNIWGQCGTTDDFCTESKSQTGAPGTAAPGTYGCISNCGQHIVYTVRTAPPIIVAYFSAWNWERSCLNMAISQIDTSYYTHIHYAFADITPDTFEVDVSRYQYQFEQFKAMKGIKRIISFGGWDFSTAAGTYRILRQATKIENRQRFAANVVAFINKHGLDGVDLDWEYPGAPDIPGVPQGDPTEGANYFATMYMLKNAIGSSKSVSFAAPASYWYLKAFPMAIMGQYLDYVIYMTYDLHGQWDAGNPWTMSGCIGGNCLRSHVNMTLTLNALSMVTKAGVPSNKIVVGVTSYGRSFRMNSVSCSGPMCTFGGTRDSSPASKGRCTETGGYISNAEINEIIDAGKATKAYYDEDSKSDILIYNNVDWVAYMTDKTKSQRASLYGILQFAGITDWAVDLQKFHENESSDPDEDWELPVDLPRCTESYSKVVDIVDRGSGVPRHCAAQYVIGALEKELGNSLDRYDALMRKDYDTKFGYFNKAVKQSFEVSLKDFYNNRHPELFDCFQQQDDGRNSDGTWRWKNVSIACPPQNKPQKAYNIFLVPKNQDHLAKVIEDDYGISWDWIHAGRIEIAPCIPDPSGSFSCDDIGKLVGRLELRGDFRMPDPKDAMQESIGNAKNIRKFLVSTHSNMRLGQEGGFGADFVDATALPVYMIEASVEAMETVYEIGDEAQKKETEMIILLVLTGFLFLLPGLGAALSSLTGIASLARISVIAAEAGGAGLGVYDIATNPDSSPLSIFAVLIGGLASLPTRGAGFVSKGASVRRSMSAKEVADMGDTVKKGLDNVSKLVTLCRR